MNALDTVILCFCSSLIGGALWVILTSERYENEYTGDYGLSRYRQKDLPPFVNLAAITLPQLIALYIACGLFLWIHGIWRLLGMWGKRKGSAPSNPVR